MRGQSVSRASVARAWQPAMAACSRYGPGPPWISDSARVRPSRPRRTSRVSHFRRSCSSSKTACPSGPVRALAREAWISISASSAWTSDSVGTGCGSSYATPFSASKRLARVMRCATVASGTRKARPISTVVSPPSRRSVSATRPSCDNTGWQATNIKRNRSSPMTSSLASSILLIGQKQGLILLRAHRLAALFIVSNEH
jgi:hypothetical protein